MASGRMEPQAMAFLCIILVLPFTSGKAPLESLSQDGPSKLHAMPLAAHHQGDEAIMQN